MFKVLQAVVKHSPIESISCGRQTFGGLINTQNRIKTSISPKISSRPYLAHTFIRHLNLNSKMASALLVIANGTEEMEAVITADVLRRGNVVTTVAGLNSAEPVVCAQGVKLVPDMSLEEASKKAYDAIVLPGGLEGSNAFCDSAELGELLKNQEAAGKYCAAICAAPTAFKQHGIGSGKSLTSYPGMAEKFKGTSYKYVEDQPVVVDGKLVTSRGPGTAYAFGLKLVELLVDKKTSDGIKSAMLVKDQ